MMSSWNLLPTIQFRSIPSIVRNSLQYAQTCKPRLKLPFLSKGLSFLAATDLIKSYFEKGSIKEAHTLFDEMSDRDVITWTAMISWYTSYNWHNRAWTVFCEMVKAGVEPNAFTISSVLKACKGMKALSCGTSVHGLATKIGIEGSLYVDNALIDMYATCCSSMHNAHLIFKDINVKNAVSWTTLITGYTHQGDAYGGLQVFRLMILDGAELSPFSFSIAIRACASIGLPILGKQVHAAVISHGFESNLPVMNSILHMYCRSNCTYEAKQYFHEMSEKDLITWNTLIAGLERLDSAESLYIFSKMESKGFRPNCFTFTGVVAACSNLAFLYCGQQLHGGIIRRGLSNLPLSNALVDMYAKCGNITDSHKIFSEMSCTNLISWTSMMIGYGSHGLGKEAVELFEEMVRSGIKPDKIVFMALLSACSHAGLVDEGLRYFRSMTSDYDVAPDREMYGCVVDMLGRAGRVKEAYQLIETMPFNPDESVWGALLGACKAHKLPSMGKLAALKVLDLKPNRVGAYVMLSNIYAAEGKWGDFAKLRKHMKRNGDKKEAGRSWIELKKQVHSFVVGDRILSQNELVSEVLELLIVDMREVGYVPDLDCLSHDLEDGT